MAKRRKSQSKKQEKQVQDYRHESEARKNIPPAKIAAEGTVPAVPKAHYEYNPHLPPVLRFDQHGEADKLPELLAEACQRPLEEDEAELLAEALRKHEPWLEWTGKREAKSFEVDPVALHIHERVSAQAILQVAQRQDVQRSLFGDPQQDYHEAVQFYHHDVDWTNRLILGDSLEVMSSLAKREGLAGKVQMIYVDPPYGIRFASNFQPEVGSRNVRDTETDLTREPEMVKAYRDTWSLGIHSYLAYLRDRLVVARDLLCDSGSMFVQINDDNVHRIRNLLDEVFGPDNFCSLIAFKKTGWQASKLLASIYDYILWYAKDREVVKYRHIYSPKTSAQGSSSQFRLAEQEKTGLVKQLADDEVALGSVDTKKWRIFGHDNLTSQGLTETSSGPITFEGKSYKPPANSHWKTPPEGLHRLMGANRIMALGKTLRQKRYLEDFPISPRSNVWDDTAVSGFAEKKAYVVQTSPKVIERCVLMTTDPGDLVLDPTCGGGTTAYVAETRGRRWITVDTSRVAIALTRQKILANAFPRYRINGEDKEGNGGGDRRPGVDPHPGFVNKTVPHIMLRDVAQNSNLDAIFAKHDPILEEKLTACNAALEGV